MTKVVTKVVNIPSKVISTVMTKIPGVSKVIQGVMKYTGISKVF